VEPWRAQTDGVLPATLAVDGDVVASRADRWCAVDAGVAVHQIYGEGAVRRIGAAEVSRSTRDIAIRNGRVFVASGEIPLNIVDIVCAGEEEAPSSP